MLKSFWVSNFGSNLSFFKMSNLKGSNFGKWQDNQNKSCRSSWPLQLWCLSNFHLRSFVSQNYFSRSSKEPTRWLSASAMGDSQYSFSLTTFRFVLLSLHLSLARPLHRDRGRFCVVTVVWFDLFPVDFAAARRESLCRSSTRSRLLDPGRPRSGSKVRFAQQSPLTPLISYVGILLLLGRERFVTNLKRHYDVLSRAQH